MTDEPDLERAASSVVLENGTLIYHENVDPGLCGYWVEAKDLRVGDVFLGANGESSTLINIVRVEQDGGIAVFNFTVEGNHNYFILEKEYDYGQSCVLVHNADRLYRNGAGQQTRKKLAEDAETAEKLGIGIYQKHIHGISTSTTKPSVPSRSALRSDIEKKFKVHETPTRSDPDHFTIELPKPVTTKVRNELYSILKPTE